MFKKIIIPILLLFLSSCGYEAKHSKKNIVTYNFFISKLTTNGNREVNIKIREKLVNYIINKQGKDLILKISSDAEKVVTAKDKAGDPTGFRYTLIINIKVMKENDIETYFQIVESFNYNNNVNRFDLKRYEDEIVNNLAETASDKLIIKLSNIQ
jgi:outer membrane lipopolysaccharide assembly protein LptE/RlpB